MHRGNDVEAEPASAIEYTPSQARRCTASDADEGVPDTSGGERRRQAVVAEHRDAEDVGRVQLRVGIE